MTRKLRLRRIIGVPEPQRLASRRRVGSRLSDEQARQDGEYRKQRQIAGPARQPVQGDIQPRRRASRRLVELTAMID